MKPLLFLTLSLASCASFQAGPPLPGANAPTLAAAQNAPSPPLEVRVGFVSSSLDDEQGAASAARVDSLRGGALTVSIPVGSRDRTMPLRWFVGADYASETGLMGYDVAGAAWIAAPRASRTTLSTGIEGRYGSERGYLFAQLGLGVTDTSVDVFGESYDSTDVGPVASIGGAFYPRPGGPMSVFVQYRFLEPGADLEGLGVTGIEGRTISFGVGWSR